MGFDRRCNQCQYFRPYSEDTGICGAELPAAYSLDRIPHFSATSPQAADCAYYTNSAMVHTMELPLNFYRNDTGIKGGEG